MTKEKFSNTGFTAHMEARIINEDDPDCGKIFSIKEVNFLENLIGLNNEEDETIWKRCENIELVENGMTGEC